MKKYTTQWLNARSRWSQSQVRLPFKPFSGKYPIRIRIVVTIPSKNHDRSVTRFSYIGKYSISAIKRAQRLNNKLGSEGSTPRVLFQEFHKNALIYSGGFGYGESFYGHNHVHLNSLNRIGNFSTRIVPADFMEEIPVRCGGFVMLVPKEQIPKNAQDWSLLYSKMRKVQRNLEQS
jgi:hypothetical protein